MAELSSARRRAVTTVIGCWPLVFFKMGLVELEVIQMSRHTKDLSQRPIGLSERHLKYPWRF